VYLALQLLERVLDAEDGLEDGALEHRDQGVEVRVDLAVGAQVIRLANFDLERGVR
jgi:hypothetical protein